MNARISIASAVAALIIASGCGGSSSITPPPNPPVTIAGGKYLYLANSGDATVSGFSISASGALTPAQTGSITNTVVSPKGLAVSSSGLLYVGSSDSRAIHRFVIDWKTGALSQQASLPPTLLTARSWTDAANLVPCGSVIYVFGKSHFTRPDDSVTTGWGFSVFNLNADGTISAAGSIGVGTNEPDPIVSNVAVDSSCKYILRAQTSANSVVEHSYDISTHHEQGFLPVGAGTAPVAVAADSGYKFLYVANSGSNDISAYAIDAPNGTLTPVPGSPFVAGSQPSFVVVTESYVYVANAGDGTVSGFARDVSSGALSPIPGSPFTVGSAPASMVIARTDLAHSPTGLVLYVANQNSGNVNAFIVQATGALQAVAGSPFSVGNGPVSMTVAEVPQ